MKFWKTKRKTFLLMAMLLCGGVASAQVVVKGNVYGGCELGKVQINSSITNSGNSTVTINGGTMEGSVYGGGMGSTDDETKGAVLGNTTVTMNNGTVERSIYGGGELGSVGTFTSHNTVHYTSGASVDVPTKCQDGTGMSTVTMSGGFVGKNGSKMPTVGSNPDDDDRGWIFCGSQGEADSINYYKAIAMGVVKETHLTISGGVVTASVYGGCENGLVLTNTLVDISGGQIGTGYNKDNDTFDPVYSDEKWTNAINAVSSEVAADINTAAGQFHECHSWPYTSPYNVYDYYYGALVDPNDPTSQWLPANSANQGSNGHSFFGNVFGGGSGYYPIAPGVWRRTAGRVNGNATVNITGGHILTSIYGGNETTDVLGKATINMSGGTLGVPRTLDQIAAHPVTCYVFGSGMGDPRTLFNKWTNVQEAEVNITGGTIFGSVFGGGEEGHVLGNAKVEIDEANAAKPTLIGTWGYSYVDGNVFGGGRGFSGEALTAGSVGGNITVNIKKGKMLGSIYGGGRLASVGTYFVQPTSPNYGQLQPGDDHGFITVNITGGTIGNNRDAALLEADHFSHTYGGNVYGGSMGRIELLNGNENSIWPRLACAKNTQVNVMGTGDVIIKGNVYGGSEKGYVRENAGVQLNDEHVTINKVFGGGYGSDDIMHHTNDSAVYPAKLAGRVMGNTKVEVMNGTVKWSVFGGGELASVGVVKSNGTLVKGTSEVVVTGGIIGNNTMYATYNPNNPSTISDHDGHVFGGGQGKMNDAAEGYKLYCNVNSTSVTVQGGKIYGSVFGGGADSHVLGNVGVAIHAGADIGTIGTTSWDGNVFGGGKGDCTVNSTAGRVAGNINVVMDGGHILSSIFGGGRQGVTGINENGAFIDKDHGKATIAVSGTVDNSGATPVYSTIIGIDNGHDLLESDESVGDIFGSGKGDTDNYINVLAGRTTNTSVTVTGFPRIYGSVFGGGEMAGVGYWATSGENVGKFEPNTGVTQVTIGTDGGTDNPLIGTEYEFTMPSSGTGHVGNWTLYDEIDGVTKLTHTATGNVYGGCQGDVDINAPAWVSMGRSHNATVNIYGGTIMSNVFGGAEQGTVAGDSRVNMKRGTVGRQSLTASDNTTYSFGSVYGGGYGSNNLTTHTNDSSNVIAAKLAGRTYGNTYVNVFGGQVYENVYGGGDIASVGWVDASGNLKNGICTVNVGNTTTPSTAIIGPMDGTGMNAYVFGGGQGVGNDYDDPSSTVNEDFRQYCNVNSTAVTVKLSTGRIHGSIYGGGSDGHVLGNTLVTLEGGTIGPDDMTTTLYGGNVFGGGRNILMKNYTAGRVAGNTHVVMNGGTVKGSVFGGGRKAITGIDVDGTMQDDVDETHTFGWTNVEIKGGSVGEDNVVYNYRDRTNGDVYGGGKGEMTGISGHPTGSALLCALTKNTEVEVSGSAHIYGIVFGGGEVANVGKYTWTTTTTAPYIQGVELVDGTGKTKVTVSGGTIGAEKMKMDYTLVGGDGDNKFDFQYNTDRGHVFGGGEGRNYNPNDNTLSPQCDVEGHRLVDRMATVGSTEVIIKGTAYVKGSVYGGAFSGHVRGNTNVKIQGGQIGAGFNQQADAEVGKYDEEKFFNVLTTPAAFNSDGDVKPEYALYECHHWEYDPATNRPFNAIAIYNDSDQTNHSHSKPTDGKTWFGNVFGGGSGYYPYYVETPANSGTYVAQWNRESGKVYGNSTVEISGGHILTSVYGGSETSDVGHFSYTDIANGGTFVGVGEDHTGGEASVTMRDGTVGVPRTFSQISGHPVTCYLFGAGKGDQRVEFNTYTNVKQSTVTVNGGKIYGSVFGGGEDGHVFYDATVNISETTPSTKPTIIGTTGRSYVDGNVFGGGRGFSGEALTAGVVRGDVGVNITGGTMLGSVYGGGRLAAVGTYLVPSTTTTKYGKMMPNVGTTEKHGEITVKIGEVDGLTQVSNITIGNDYEAVYHTDFSQHPIGGNVFAGGMGRIDNLDGSTNDSWYQFGRVKNTTLKIGQASGKNTVIKGSVYGGGELGMLGGELGQTENHDASITISGGTIWRNVYGGGFGSDDNTKVVTLEPGVTVTPMQLAGLVQGNTTVSVTGGWVKKCIYGGGEFGTVGTISSTEIHPEQVGETPAHPFNLSWPCAYTFENNTGTATISITGGRVGVTGKDYMGPWNTSGVPYNPSTNEPLTDDEIEDARVDNGDLYGGGKGKAGDRYEMANLANVNNTVITITYPENNGATPQNYNAIANGVYTYDCIAGAVYGGAENGHVNTNTSITLNKGLVGHSMYGGGKGKGTYETTLEWQYDPSSGTYVQVTPYTASVYSITAGKVYGNTNIVINDGYVVRSIFGGGNLGSVGKGNYAGGVNDYSASGYGEKITNASDWDYVHNSGQCNVTVKGGTIGMLNSTNPDKVFKDGTPYGTVFGGCRGVPVPTVPRTLTPRYKYCPEDFLGYVNYTFVTIGDNTVSTAPRLYGSVYGGAQDGHVRENTNTTVNKGEIGVEYNETGTNSVGETDVTSKHWTERGSVYGAGSGIGQWEDQHGNKYYCNIAGSVTQFSNVTINGGTIHNNVYGGGNLATVGPPRIRQTEDCPIDSTKVMVSVTGGILGHENDAHYGGFVFGASRGKASNNVNDFKNFALCSYTQVNISGGTIANAVFGGGENGQVGSYHENATTHVEDSKGNHNTLVNINGGTIKHSVYGGGQGMYGETGYANDTISGRVLGNTTVNLMGGTIGVDNGNYAAAIYGGCRNANIWGNTNVNVGNSAFEGEVTIFGSVYGANNHAGTPYGNVNVDVYSTAHTGSSSAVAPNFEGLGNSYPNVPTGMTPAQKLAWLESIPKDESNFAIYQVFGGSNQADYTPRAGKKARVKVWQCDKNTVFDVYGGSNAAAIGTATVPSEANVIIEGGRMNRVFGGGNGSLRSADVHGPANTTINAGLINELYGGSNNAGLIDVVNLVVNPEGTCPQIIGDVFSGGNEALVIGDVITTVECCDAVYGNFYCGTHYATIYGNVTANIFGGTYSNIFAGSKGQLGNPNANPPVPEKPAHIRRFPIDNDDLEANYPADHQAALAAYLATHDVWGQGGNITLNIFGGTITNAFGGSDVNGNIDGKIQVNVFNVGGTCNLALDYLYGAGRNTPYTPNYTVSSGQQRLTPEINVIHGTVAQSVFGGGYGELATTTACPVVNIGYYADLGVYGHEGDLMDKLFDTIHAHSDEPGHPWVAPTDYLATVGHEVYGGGESADIIGHPAVNVYKSNTSIASVYGAGKGSDLGSVNVAKVHGSTAVKIYDGLIGRNVFGGGAYAIVTGDTRVEMSGGTVGTSSEWNLLGSVFGGGQGSTNGYDSQGHPVSGNEDYGRVMGNTYVDISGSAHILKEVYGGGMMGSVGSGQLNKTTGITHVTIRGGEIGPFDAVYNNANVFGGGQGRVLTYPSLNPNIYTTHANVDSASVIITDAARVYGSVFGGSSSGHVLGGTYVQVKKGTGTNTPTIGTTGLSGEEGHVYGGGQGVTGSFTAGRVGGITKVEVSDGNILGCVFGGGRKALVGVDVAGSFDTYVDDHDVYDTIHHGTTQVVITGGTIGTDANGGLALLTSDQVSGNVYGAGRGEPEEHIEDDWGRVAKSVLTISGSPVIYGSVYGGGQMANVGHWLNYANWYAEGTSVATVNISGSPTIGTAKEFTKTYADTNPTKTWYETINGKKMLVHTRTGNVYGSGQGDVKLKTTGTWAGHPEGFEQGHCGKTFVYIQPADPANTTDSPTIMGSVFGGAEQGAVWGDTRVEISCGTIGTVTNTDDDGGENPNLANNYAFGSVFGGSYGRDAYIHMGLPATALALDPDADIPQLVDSINGLTGHVYGNTRVIITGGTIRENVFGGGDMAIVGEVNADGSLKKGKCTVEVSGKTIVGPLDMTGLNGYVYGGGKGIGNDPQNLRKKYCNVNETDVTVNLIFAHPVTSGDVTKTSRPDNWDVETDGRIYGSIFGGGADGHTLGDAKVKLQGGLIGTQGITSWDGNIFGGGRNFQLYNYTAGRVGGNITVEMTGGHLLGSLYGGGRNALTGLGEDVIVNTTTGVIQALQDGDSHGKVTVKVMGGVVGNNTLTHNTTEPTETFIETFSDYSMGSVYGGGMGTKEGINGHTPESALLISMVKDTDVQISQEDDDVPTHIYGIVFGGGEMAAVGSCTWTQDSNGFDNIDMKDGTGLAKVSISGGIIGTDRSKMRYEPGAAPYNMYPKYNDDLGYVYGGGEGYSDDPTNYSEVGTANFGTMRLLDIMASVNNTEVSISGGWVKASVFGGAEAGHVLQNTKVTISGGQIGAGDNKTDDKDVLYTDGTNGTTNQFINPVETAITAENSLKGTYHWPFGASSGGTTVYNPYDPVYVMNGILPSDGKSWFGNVFGGGSGWFPYIKKNENNQYQSYWNANSGKVFGNTEVIITGGHILNNVYGGNEATDVGGKATVKMSGGTVGVPRLKDDIVALPTLGYVFGGGCGDERTDFNTLNVVDSTKVQITGGIIYGSVYGGAEDGHVLGDARTSVNANDATTVIGCRGTSSVDGNVFGGGRNFLASNKSAGRVGGNTYVNVIGGIMLGTVYGGGRMAQTGVGQDGEYNNDNTKGKSTVNIGGTAQIGNGDNDYSAILYETDESIADVYGGGKGDSKNSNIEWAGRVTNSEINISGTPRIYGGVWGGGEMAGVGYWGTDGKFKTGTGESLVNIGREGQSDNPVIGTDYEYTKAYMTTPGGWTVYETNNGAKRLLHTCTGNVCGGSRGEANNKPGWVRMARSRTATVTVNGGTIKSCVYGGPEQGFMTGNATVNIKGGTIGQENLVASNNSTYSFGSVFGGGYGAEEATPQTNDSTNALAIAIAGRVYGNTFVNISGGQIKENVFGGGDLATVGMVKNNVLTNGVATVTMTGGEVGPLDMTGLNGYVYGGSKGVGVDLNSAYKNYCNVNTTIVTVEEGTNASGGVTSPRVYGSLFGGGSDGHVLGDATVNFNGGTLGTWGTTTWDGNIFGGGRNYKATNMSAGRVAGNIHVNMASGTMLGNIYGGGRVASTGVDVNGDTITGTGHGYVYVNVTGGTIGYEHLASNCYNGSNQPVEPWAGQYGGDVFGGAMGADLDPHTTWTGAIPTSETDANFAAYTDYIRSQSGWVKNTEVKLNGGTDNQVLVRGCVFGGSKNGRVSKNTKVTVEGNSIVGVDRGNPDDPKPAADLAKLFYSGSVYGGGLGSERSVAENVKWPDVGRVYGNTEVYISNNAGGTPKILNNIYGGGALAGLGTLDNNGNYTNGINGKPSGNTYVEMSGGELGPLDMSGTNAYAFAGGQGQPPYAFKDFGKVNNTHMVVKKNAVAAYGAARVYGSLFGGGEDGHVVGNALIDVEGGYLGTTGQTTWDGNIFGGGRNFNAAHKTTGRVGGNVNINVKEVEMRGSVFGGGRLGSVGVNDLDGNAFGMQDGDGHGFITVNIGGTMYGTDGQPLHDANNNPITQTGPIIIGHTATGEQDRVGGNVYGGGKGIAGAPTTIYPDLAMVKQATVNIGETSGMETWIEGSVFGSGEDGHVLQDTYVNVYDGQIGGKTYNPSNPELSGDYFHGNVYGGGRGLDTWKDNENVEHYSSTAGVVYGNTNVYIEGGRICRFVYGGGNLASVGTYPETPVGGIYHTGLTKVTITGDAKIGVAANSANRNGNVFGAGKGMAGSAYKNLSLVRNTEVTVTGESHVFGTVFGSGEDGHVIQRTNILIGDANINGTDVDGSKVIIGTNGESGVDGNVYGAGRGLDKDPSGNYSATAGIVGISTNIVINDGKVMGSVFGGGRMASVGHEHALDSIQVGEDYKPITANIPEDFGWANIHITGDATIGANNTYDNGHVFGSGMGTLGYANLTSVFETHVTVNGDATVHGTVYGGGEVGHVKYHKVEGDNGDVEINGNTYVTIGGNSTVGSESNHVIGGGYGDLTSLTAGKVDGIARVTVKENARVLGSVVGGGRIALVEEARIVNIEGGTVERHVLGGNYTIPTAATGADNKSLKTVNIRDGLIKGSVFGCSYEAVEGNLSTDWTSFVNITGGTIGTDDPANNDEENGNVYAAGYGGTVNGSVCINVGYNPVLSAPNHTANIYANDNNITPSAGNTKNLVIKGDVFGGSFHVGSGQIGDLWNTFDVTGYSVVYIDGTKYDTRNAAPTSGQPKFMNIEGGLYGCGTHCESGELGRDIILRNYGHRNATGGVLSSATRDIKTAQRCSNLVFDNANVNFTGYRDISGMSDSLYAVVKINGHVYVANASSMALGSIESPAYMDSIVAVHSTYLKPNDSVYTNNVVTSLPWGWIGLKDNSSSNADVLIYMDGSEPGNPLSKAQENVILFNGRSRLWVRYHIGKKQFYGDLEGFFRMKSEYQPYGNESFAYARPKLTELNGGISSGGTPVNDSDGGFLSYNTEFNFHTLTTDGYLEEGNDGGEKYTNTKQYPYSNVMETTSKGDMEEFRLWAIPKITGRPWYVDGKRGFGKNNMDIGRGLYPDMPKLTVSAEGSEPAKQGVYAGGYDFYTTDLISFKQSEDVIYVVGAVNSAEELKVNASGILNQEDSEPLRLYRYPGGHRLSTSSATDPGANYEALVEVRKCEEGEKMTLNKVVIDGLFGYDGFDAFNYAIPNTFNEKGAYMPMVVTYPETVLNLEKGTHLMNGYNKIDVNTISITHENVTYTFDNFYPNPDFKNTFEVTPGVSYTIYNGAGLYVDEKATVNVSDMVTIEGNKQCRMVHGLDHAVESNVYLPTFEKSLTIVAPLEEKTTIGVTSPIRNTADSYEYNTFSPVAAIPDGSNVDTIKRVWRQHNFRDDQEWFFGNGGHTTYHTNVADAGYMNPYEVYFGWTWANVVRKAPTDFAINNLNSAEDLAWLISMNTGMNGYSLVADPTNFSGTDLVQTADLDMKQYVWVPIGEQGSGYHPFAGNYDGQGHLIANMNIDFIGNGDNRYQRKNYGLFGYVTGHVDRTFVVSGKVKPEFDVADSYNLGGLVGCLNGGSVTSSEAAADITCPDMAGTDIVTGGLVAKMESGTIHSSMAMSWITTRDHSNGYVGGLVGSAKDGKIYNSFVNGRFSIGGDAKVGGLMGENTGATMMNCYANWSEITGGTSTNFMGIVHTNSEASNVDVCYYKETGGFDAGSVLSSCKTFTPTASADRFGYMYKDNKVLVQDAVGNTPAKYQPLFQLLDKWAKDNTTSSVTYARWARPGLADINGDYPVLLLCDGSVANIDATNEFRSLSTYNKDKVLQYGGKARDNTQLSTMLGREEYVFVYGDVNENVTTPLDVKASKVSIYEHASILHPSLLTKKKTSSKEDTYVDYENTYVGVTFDNSYGHATSTPGMNYGLVGMGGFLLPRDWHMFSTPLSRAPLGFDYKGQNAPVSEHVNFNGTPHDPAGYYNNIWESTTSEFSWLTTPGSSECASGADERYWMKSYDVADGYFPTTRGQTITSTDNLSDWFILDSDECPSDGKYRYPYGMDFYTWTEPDYHWINFKRNGPNHWHSDIPHVHLDYEPYDGAPLNKNEDNLIVGRGYMAAIAAETFMQSHGTLNVGEKTIPLTTKGYWFQGWNLVGNPYHGYIDFDAMVKTDDTYGAINNEILAKKDGNPFYVVYNADAYGSTGGAKDDKAGTAFRYYTPSCSRGGEYAQRYMHPHQGFYVRAEHAGNLYFEENFLANRATVGDNGDFRDDRPAYPLVNLYLSSDQGCADVTVIEFERPEWGGAQKLKELRVGDGLFYAHHDGTYYAALFAEQGIDRVPLWFEAKEDDIFTMKWNTANADFHSMYLIDNINGIHYDMLMNDTYTFEGHKGDYPSRFLIVFNLTDVEELGDEPNNFIFHNGTEWIVTGEGMLQFIDVNGQVLWQDRVSGGQSRVSLPWVAEGPYLFRLTNSKETKVQKVIVRH